MGYNKIKLGTFFTLMIVLLAVYYRNTNDVLQKRLHSVLKALENLEKKHKVNPNPRVAVGYGICTDVYIEAGNLLEYTDQMGEPEHFDEITTKEELLKSFANYFRHGAAAEYVFVKKKKQLELFRHESFINFFFLTDVTCRILLCLTC